MGRAIVRNEELEAVSLALDGRSGHFSASQLYDWYVQWAEREGENPVHPVRFGQMLAAYGGIRRPIWDAAKGYLVKGWLI